MADLVPMSQAATTSLVTTLQNTDLFALAREDDASETGYRSKVARVDAMAKKVVNESEYSQLQTTDKKIIGAINEVNAKASRFDNMTATASGSIATFTDGGDDIPVSEYECDIVAQQASGTPTPVSPLPITGFSQADIFNTLPNAFNNADVTVGYFLNSDGTTTANTGWVISDYMPITSLFGYTGLTGIGTAPYSCYYDENKNYISGWKQATGENVVNNAPNNAKYVRMSISQTDATNNVLKFYPYYDKNTVAFGQTIYGGKLVYKNGQWAIEATYGIVVIDNTISSDAVSIQVSTGGLTVVRIVTGTPAVNDNEQICNIATYNANAWQASGSENVFVMGGEDNVYLRVSSSLITTQSDALTFFANTPMQICYKLATPVIIPITSSTRVKTISGVNNIFSNTGDNSVEYFTNKADSLAELIKAFVL